MATGFQRSKAAYLEQEGQLRSLVEDTEFQTHFQNWLDATVTQLDVQFDVCEQTLGELQQAVKADEGSYWTGKTLTQHCNLCIPEHRLLNAEARLREGEHISWPDMMRLNETLVGLSRRLPEQSAFLKSVVEELSEKNVTFAPREMGIIGKALEVKLGDETADSLASAELERIQRLVDKFTPELREIEVVIDDSLVNGDIAMAAEQSLKQLEFYEAQLAAILQQYPIITRRHTDNAEQARRRRWHIFRMANKDITSVMEAKLRQKEACLEDQRRLDEQVANYNNDDVYQRRRYMLDREQSDEYLRDNKHNQKQIWNRINKIFSELIDCQKELGHLARARVDEVQRRLRIEESEAARRSGHSAFKNAAEHRTRLLQDTVANAERAYRLAKTLNAFTLDQCDSVTNKYDQAQGQLQDRLQRLRHTHFDCFSEYYLKAARLIDRREQQKKRSDEQTVMESVQLEIKVETLNPESKRHAMERDRHAAFSDKLKVEIAMLKERVMAAEEDVTRLVLRPFDRQGIPFLHPSAIAGEISLIRATKVIDIRDNLVRAKDPDAAQDARNRELLDVAHRNESRRAEKLAVISSRVPHAPQAVSEESRKNYTRYEKLVDRAAAVAAAIMPPTAPPATRDAEDSEKPIDHGASPAPAIPRFGVAATERFAQQPKADARGRTHTGAAPYPIQPAAQTMRGQFGQLRDGCTVRALFSYRGSDSDELTFNKGDEFLCVTRAVDEGWYIGVLRSQQGIFPANYVRPVE